MMDRPPFGYPLERVKDQSLRRDRVSLPSPSSSRLGSQNSILQEPVNNPIPPHLHTRTQSHIQMTRHDPLTNITTFSFLQSRNNRSNPQATFKTKFKNLETGEEKDVDNFYQLRNSLETLEGDELEFLRTRRKKLLSPKPRITHVADNVKTMMRDIFGPDAPIMEDEVHLFEYDSRRVFWTVIVGPTMCIVKGGTGWRVWLGPEEAFSKLQIGHPQTTPQGVSYGRKEANEEKGKQIRRRKACTSYTGRNSSEDTSSEELSSISSRASSDFETRQPPLKKTRRKSGENANHNVESQQLEVQPSGKQQGVEVKKEESSAHDPFIITSDDDCPAPKPSQCGLSQGGDKLCIVRVHIIMA